nr:MAG: capsid protein [Smacoviridae sp.]
MATNYVKASYTEVVDLQTTNGSTSVIGIHTPVGINPYTRLKGFFSQFRKFRYKGISSLVMVNAAQLPVDPLGLTGVNGTTDLMDPRDTLNPILFKGCHGENLSHVLNTIYSYDEIIGSGQQNSSFSRGKNVSDSAYESLVPNSIDSDTYYKQLTDTSWRKFGIQSGVRLKRLRPLVHKMAMSTPILPTNLSDATGNLVGTSASTDTSGEMASANNAGIVSVNPQIYKGMFEVNDYNGVNQQNKFEFNSEFTNGMQALGWLPTTMPYNSTLGNYNMTGSTVTMLPKLYMGVLVLPPSYNVEQFFRMVIRHEFEFKDFTSSLGPLEANGGATLNDCYFNWIDYSVSSAKTAGSVSMRMGESLDIIGGSSEIVSDGVS